MSQFGKWVLGSALLAWFYTWADSLVVGMYLGSHELGIYRMGTLMAGSVFELVAAPLMPVVYSYLSLKQYRGEELKHKIFLGEKLMAMVLFPIIMVILLSSDYLVEVLFEDSWEGVGSVLALIATAHGIAYTVSLRQLVYQSIGKPDVETKIMFVSMLIRLPFYLVFIQKGLLLFLVGRLIAVQLGILNHLTFAKLVLDYEFSHYLKAIWVPAVSAMFSGLLGYYALHMSAWMGPFGATIIGTLLSAVCYLLFLLALDFGAVKKVNDAYFSR